MTLLAVPNFSEGRSELAVEAIARALGRRAVVLDRHTDRDHNRSVYTLCGSAHELSDAVVEGAKAAIGHVDMSTHTGVHPHVGVLDVAPFVYTEPEDRGAATAAALLTADRLADELGLPVFLYGELSAAGLTRAQLRRGGPGALAERIGAGEMSPEFGPRRLDPRHGATLVSARPPLVAFNLELAPPADLATARRVAAEIRDLPGVRAIGVELARSVLAGPGENEPVAQVSTNLEDPEGTPPSAVLDAVQQRARVSAIEFVGLPLARHLTHLPVDLPRKGHGTLEERLL